MTRDFSSDATLFYKILYPGLWATVSGSAAVMLFLHPDEMKYKGVMGATPHWFVYSWAAGSIFGTIFVLWYFGRFKYVGIENGALLVSNYWTDWRIPFSMIADARQTRFMDPMHITISLSEDPGCGREVLFMPKQSPVLSFSLGTNTVSMSRPNTQLADFKRVVSLPARE